MPLKQAHCNLKLLFLFTGEVQKRHSGSPDFTKAVWVGMHVFNLRGVKVVCGALTSGQTELKSKWQHFELCDENHKAEIKKSEYIQL